MTARQARAPDQRGLEGAEALVEDQHPRDAGSQSAETERQATRTRSGDLQFGALVDLFWSRFYRVHSSGSVAGAVEAGGAEFARAAAGSPGGARAHRAATPSHRRLAHLPLRRSVRCESFINCANVNFI